MFLKRVTVSGFKSFADKVDFDFGPGVTCIVGPNGCGKSNVVDAFKWVVGEQSARSLRGRQMIDMIFNGSSTRRSSSVAQVDLAFDNKGRRLGLDTDEVVITRKLYRSGESEYLLNNTITRLKDIRELFMDTGIGVDSYSVIEQGKVDGLLQSSPADRRVIFEEAAGISKYKARKKEAQRKLERTQQNLLRVEDVIEELERRLRSVKLQAGKARNYKEYEARLNELRSKYVLAEYHRLSQRSERLAGEARTHGDRVTELRTLIDRTESEEAEITEQLDRLAAEISTTDNRLVQARSSMSAQEERIESAGKRIEEQEAIAERARQRHDSDLRRRAEAENEIQSAERAAQELQQQLDDLHATIDRLNEEETRRASELARAQAELEEEKAGIIDLLRKSAQVHNEIVRLNSHRESLVTHKGRLASRDAQIAAEMGEQRRQLEEARAGIAEVERLIEERSAALAEKKAEATRVDDERQQLVDRTAELKEKRSALLSQRQLLDDLQRKMEGVGAGVRELLADRGGDGEPGSYPSVIGLVADIIDADVAHAHLVEAILGSHDQDILVRDSEAFLREVGPTEELPGKVTVLALDRIPPVVNERDFSGLPGFVARAAELVRVPEQFESAARHLFAKTVVVESLRDGLAMAANDTSGHRFVTRAGDIIEPDGRVTIGPGGPGTGLISRRSELRQIESELGEVDRQLESLTDQLNRTRAEASHIEEQQQELRTALYQANTDKVELSAAVRKHQESIDRLSHEKPLIDREVAAIEQEIEEVLARARQDGQKLEALERENEEREAKVRTQQEGIDRIVADRRALHDQLTEAKVAAGQVAQKRASAVESVNTLRRTLHELNESITAAEHDVEQCRQRIEEAKQSIETGKAEVARLSREIIELEQSVERLRARREHLRADVEEKVAAVKRARQELAEVEEKLHNVRMEHAEVGVRRDELVSRVREELEIDLVARYKEYEYEEEDWAQVEAEIGELRQKMQRLGNVNLGAIDELAELEERYAFLTGQRDDLTTSQRQLEQLIQRLDTESRERFNAAFNQVREHFRSLFRKLFGGGKADVVLEDPENALDCGIEIVAQPPGKELQSISLMSGGEKSLTAIALLMSIFKIRPAPFAILDEVDAALDEANNDRFNRIIQEFVSEAQFIIITHSKRTMNIGEQLYGITMQEPGVSTRVSVQLTDVHAA